jgi:hypothetical protein
VPGDVAKVASINENQVRTVRHILVKNVAIHKSVADNICGQIQRVKVIEFLNEEDQNCFFVLPLMGSTAVFRLSNPEVTNVQFSVLVCETGSLMICWVA